MKYIAIIELDKDRETCMGCPLCDCEDNCGLQPDNQYTESWQDLLLQCPLKEVE